MKRRKNTRNSVSGQRRGSKLGRLGSEQELPVYRKSHQQKGSRNESPSLRPEKDS